MDAFRNDSEAPKREAGHPDTSRVEGAERLSVWRRRARHAARHLLVLGIRARRDRRVLATVALLVVGAGVTGGRWWQTCGVDGCPTPEALREWRPRAGDRLLTHDGQLLGLLDPVRRVPVAYASIPTHVRDAFVAVEDRRFREHGGIDVRGILRAAVNNLRAGGVREGASTITMQLARNAFLTDEVRGWKRKALEVRYAWLLESALDKDEILERYLNTIYFGNGTWGVEAASRDLLGKSIVKATVADAALLAGLPKAPSTYNPRRNAERARARRDVVLGVLVDAGMMDSSAAARERARPVRVPSRAWRPDWPAHTWAVDAVRSTLDSLQNAGVLPGTVRMRDLVVHTTVDARAQRAAERALAMGAARVDGARDDARAHPTQGALVALDPGTGAVRAVAGGRAVDARGFNRALQARRQVGSTFKPFVYAAAVAHGYAGNHMLSDEPLSIRTGRTTWTPTNFGNRHDGVMSMRTALVRSNNTATVRLAQDIGNAPIIALARSTGIASPLPDVPSLSLGSASLTPVELTSAYAAFANGVWRVVPHLVTRVETADGTLLWERTPSTRERALSVEDAFLVTSFLRSAVDQGTGRAVREYGVQGPVAGKTGTTNDGTDAWFVGYSPTLVTSVWLGTDAPRSLGAAASGGRYAAPVWAQFMRAGWHSPEQDREWRAPPTLKARTIDANTGKLFGDWCDGEPAQEWFKPGTEPTARCDGGWFRWARGEPGLPDDAIDAAVDVLGEAIGEGRVRQSLLRMLANELRRSTPTPASARNDRGRRVPER
jgi:1A family penicillin-binding protein